MSKEYVDNYEKSLTATLPTLSFSTITKKEYIKGRELDSITESQLQKIADAICSEFSLPTIPVEFKGRQPHNHDGKKLKKKIMGIHRRTNFGNSSIQVYKYTAKQKKQYAPKSAISTLVHEICHYFDYELCRLKKSLHTKGFYGRIRQLTEMLS